MVTALQFGGVEVVITGPLNALLGDGAFPNGIRSGVLVAEARYIATPTIDDAVFCYWRRAA